MLQIAHDSRPVRGFKGPPRKSWKNLEPAYFTGIEWTKSFVKGPLDPINKKYQFYCQFCQTNVSIFSKGARELVGHYQSETHHRKDQCWLFDQLGKMDKITGVTKHAVRGRHGHVLTAMKLEKEKPLIEHAPLVDIGPRYPFCDENMEIPGGLTTPADVQLGS